MHRKRSSHTPFDRHSGNIQSHWRRSSTEVSKILQQGTTRSFFATDYLYSLHALGGSFILNQSADSGLFLLCRLLPTGR